MSQLEIQSEIVRRDEVLSNHLAVSLPLFLFNFRSQFQLNLSYSQLLFLPISYLRMFIWVSFFLLTAYEILSDEQKRKNYDLYGDEKGNPGFEAGHPGGQGGYTHWGGPGHSSFSFRPGEWQGMGGQGESKSFSFSFGGPGDSNAFGFGLDDLLGNFFGGGGRQFGGFGSSTNSQSGSKSSPKSLRAINSHIYKKEIADEGMTWLLLSYTPSVKGIQYFESTVEDVASSLEGAIKVVIYF